MPVVLDGEQLGVVACGPKRAGVWTDGGPHGRRDVRPSGGTGGPQRPAHRAPRRAREELAASRTRLVRAQESERRRIERNIHDGVQQDLVALIGLAGQIRTRTPAQPTTSRTCDCWRGLARVLDDLRDLARGIHPSLLSDKGLLAAVEALAARHPVPVDLWADPRAAAPALRRRGRGRLLLHRGRGAGEHAQACPRAARVRGAGPLRRRPGDHRDRRRRRVPPADLSRPGTGPHGMKDRFAALNGSVDVNSRPGRGTTVSARISVGAPLAS